MGERFALPSLEVLREQAEANAAERGLSWWRARAELAARYGVAGWAELEREAVLSGLQGVERVLVLADAEELGRLLAADPEAAVEPVTGLAPMLVLLRRSVGSAEGVRACAEVLLGAGADPRVSTAEWDGQGRQTALFDAVERDDVRLARLLVESGAVPDEDAFYHACEQGDVGFLDLLYRPDFERLVVHKLDFEDAAGLAWLLRRGVDVNAAGALHHAIARGRGTTILSMLLEAGAEVDLPWDRWDVGRRPLALAARCGHLAAYELLAERGAQAELDEVDAAVLAVARGESTRLPSAPPPALGIPGGTGYGWVLGQFALLGRTEIVRGLLEGGMAADTRGWSNFTPLEQAAMHGRAEVVRLLIASGADIGDRAFDADGPTPLDCALWGLRNNRADDGDYPATVAAMVDAGAPTRLGPPTGDVAIDALLAVDR